MRKKLLFRAWLLLALMLVGAGSAWADTHSGTVAFAAMSRITNNNDGTFTTAGKAGNGYALALADLGDLSDISLSTSVHLEFNVTIPSGSRWLVGIGDKDTRGTTANGSSKATYNTDGLVMRFGTSDGNNYRFNGGTANNNLFGNSVHVEFDLDRVNSTYSYTLTNTNDNTVGFSASGVETSVSNATVVEAYSWLGNTTITISDVTYSYEVPANSFNYSVDAVDLSGNTLQNLESGVSTSDKDVYFPKTIQVGSDFYNAQTSPYVVTATESNPNPTVSYDGDETGILAFIEGENVGGKYLDTPNSSYSNGYGGHVNAGSSTAFKGTSLGTFSEGTYIVYVSYLANSNRGLYLRDANEANANDANVLASLGSSALTAAGVYTMEITLDAETNICLSGYTASNGRTNQSADFDYAYIVKKVVLYELDGAESDGSPWKSTSAQGSISLVTDDESYSGGQYVMFSPGQISGSRDFYNASLSSGTFTNYVFEFDAAITPGSQNATSLYVLTENKTGNSEYSGDNFLFKLVNGGGNSTNYTINGGSETITLGSGTWYHFTLEVDKEAGTVSYSVNGVTGTYTYTGDADMTLKEVFCLAGRYNPIIKFDNLSITADPKPYIIYTTKTVNANITDVNLEEPVPSYYPENATVTYSSSDENIAKVDATGNVMMLDGGTVTITATITVNGKQYSDYYDVNINAVGIGQFNTVSDLSTAAVEGKFGERMVEDVPLIVMYTGDIENTENISLIRTVNNKLIVTTLASDGWHDVQFDTTTKIPTEGSFYKFVTEAAGELKVIGFMTGDNAVKLVDAEGNEVGSWNYVSGAESTLQTLTANLSANTTYYLYGLNPLYDDPTHTYAAGYTTGWCVFQLHSFQFTPNFRFAYPVVVYRDGKVYDIDNNEITSGVTVSGNSVRQTELSGATSTSYKIDAYGDIADGASASGAAINFDSTKGGSIVVNCKDSDSGLSAHYVIVVPYTTHKWNFGPENTVPQYSDLTERKEKYDIEWVVNARLKQTDGSGLMDRYSYPLISAKNSITGDNILYFNNTDGLIFKTSGKSLAYEVKQNEGYTKDELVAAKLAEKIAELQASEEYQAMSDEEKAEAEAAVEVTPQELNKLLYNLFNYADETTVSNPGGFWIGYTGGQFTIPFAKAGQYVKIHWDRYTGGNGSDFTATNLLDLEGNEVTETFRMTGFHSSYTNPRGLYIFQVKEDGPVTFTKADNGWTEIADIELTDEYNTQLRLIEVAEESTGYSDPSTNRTDQPLSLASNGMTGKTMYFSAYSGQTYSANATEAVISVDPGDSGVTVDVERVVWFSSGRADYYRYSISADNNSGNGNVKLTEKVSTVAVTSGSPTYVIDKIENWIAVGTVTPQAYPRTWDFTAQNMDYATASKATMDATADTDNYGEWSVDSETDAYANKNITKDPDMYLHTYNAEGGDKPLFANGSELTAGGATFAETIGIGVTAWDETAADNITLSGEALTGVKAISVPMLSAGDYVYVMASSEPTATVTAYTATTADGKTTYAEADGASVSTQDAKYLGNGVYGFKVGAGENVNMDITFDAETEVYKIGVSNIEKTFDKYGFSTESRDKNIDYSFISAPAYAITDNEFAYNYDQVVVTPTEQFGITPANTGVMLFNDALASDASPLFYAGNNLMDGTTNLPEADVTLAGQNMLVPIVEGGTISQHQTNSEDVDCDAFVLTYIYSTYSSTEGADVTTNADFGTDAFFRVKGSIEAPANKAYLLVPSENLPNALWDGGNGQGTAGAVKNLVRINFGEDDDTPTAIDSINIADAESLDNATWYNLSGQKLSGKPATKGVYIVNGKKVMVK